MNPGTVAPVPPAPRDTEVVRAHGRELPDPYRWLEDGGDSRTQSWLPAVAAEGRALLDALPGRGLLVAHYQRVFGAGLPTVPLVRGNRTFLGGRRPGEEHATLRVREGDGAERVLLDPMDLDATGTTTLDDIIPSPDGLLVACLVTRGGTEEGSLLILDSQDGTETEPALPGCRALSTVVHWEDERTLLLTRRALPGAATGSQFRLMRHRLGTPGEQDSELYGAGLESLDSVMPVPCPDGRHVALVVAQPPASATDVRLLDLRSGRVRDILVGSGAEIHAQWDPDGRLLLRTTLDAPTWRLLAVGPALDSPPSELLPADPATVLRGVAVAGPHLVVHRTRDEVAELTLHDRVTGLATGAIDLPGRGTVGGPTAGPEDTVYIAYGDHLRQQSIYIWRPGDARISPLLMRDQLVDMSDIHVEDVEVASADGTLVPMVILYRGARRGPRPALVYVYGGFGYSVCRPAFDVWGNGWVAAGGVYALVGARGGGERGDAWHQAGARGNKQNTFADAVAAGDWLVENGYTTRDRVGLMGMSNGALTTAAVIQRWPDRFAAAACIAMGTDMLRSLRTGEEWMHEYGDGRVPEEFAWLLAQSPYHNAVPGTCYPATLVCAFGGDTRTPAYEGHKFVALMRWAQGCDRPVVLRHEDGVGHAVRSVSRSVELLADIIGFMADRLALDLAAGLASGRLPAQ